MTQIIFLHGASSSGKTTIAEALRARASRDFPHLSLDHFRDSGALRPKDYPDWSQARACLFSGFHTAIAAFAHSGNDLILKRFELNLAYKFGGKRSERIDVARVSQSPRASGLLRNALERILDTQGWRQNLVELLGGQQLLFVGVHTSLGVLNRHETARGDRVLGSAEWDFHKIHAGLRYDIEVDGAKDPGENATKIIATLDAQTAPSTFFDL